MKKLNQLLMLAILIMAGVLGACSDNDDGPIGQYASGVLVVNEGNFLDADGSISYYNPSTQEAETNIFSKVNNEAVLGDIVQSMTVHGDNAYIIVNNSNKVEVVNAHTMKSITTIDVDYPRYMTLVNGKGYITVWGSNFETPGVAVIDLTTNTLVKTILTDTGAEEVILANGKLYVANRYSNTISVIDPATDEVVSTITTDYYGVSGLVVDKDNNVWGVYEGGLDWTTGAEFNDGALVRLNTSDDLVDVNVLLNMNLGERIAINNTGDKLYFYKGTKVYSMDLSGSTFEPQELINEEGVVTFYGIGVNQMTNELYLADNKGFQGNGVAYRYNSDGTKIESFATGRGPNGFVFK